MSPTTQPFWWDQPHSDPTNLNETTQLHDPEPVPYEEPPTPLFTSYAQRGFPGPPAETICYCVRTPWGSIAHCDDPGCLIKRYHCPCVGLKEAPLEYWCCPFCRGTRQSVATGDVVARLAMKRSENYDISGNTREAMEVTPGTATYGRWMKGIAIRKTLRKVGKPRQESLVESIENEGSENRRSAQPAKKKPRRKESLDEVSKHRTLSQGTQEQPQSKAPDQCRFSVEAQRDSATAATTDPPKWKGWVSWSEEEYLAHRAAVQARWDVPPVSGTKRKRVPPRSAAVIEEHDNGPAPKSLKVTLKAAIADSGTARKFGELSKTPAPGLGDGTKQLPVAEDGSALLPSAPDATNDVLTDGISSVMTGASGQGEGVGGRDNGNDNDDEGES